MDDPGRSARYLLHRLEEAGPSPHLYTQDALYWKSIEWTCDLLNIVDEVTEPTVATMITDAIYGRLTGRGAAEADQRIRQHLENVDRIMREQRPITFFQYSNFDGDGDLQHMAGETNSILKKRRKPKP